jgi:hypothetical protein
MNRIHLRDAQLSFVGGVKSRQNMPRGDKQNGGSGMPILLKSTVLGLGLLAGVAATASAQSVSALPPAGSVTAPTTPPPVTSSTQSFYPKPGGNGLWQEEHHQPSADYNSDKAQHPYSTSIGPKPGSHSSGQDEHYQATEQDSTAARRPYSASGVGPRPN